MQRETAINVLLGAVLVSIFSLGVAAVFLALRLALYATDWLVARAFPALRDHQSIAIIGVLTTFLLVSSVQSFRRRAWRKAFVDVALPAVYALVLATDLRLGRSPDPLWFFVFVVGMGNMPKSNMPSADISKRELFVSCFICTLLMVETVWFGFGTAHELIRDSMYVFLFAWFSMRVRENWIKNDSPSVA